MEKKQKVKSDEIDLISIVDKVWSERRFLIKFTLVIFVIGVIIAFSLPRTYKSESKIIPEDTKEVVTNKANSFAS
ncbi:MAG TPA: chain-length determining protein, partial [Candidatus Butyricimonas faecavium]|nr:chain-length determining protein [Candidatus Butyricimonas faecavium]